MNFNMREVALASDLIYSVLLRLKERGAVDIDLASVDFEVSAKKALEKDFLDENLVEDDTQTAEGLNKKAIRYAWSAVYVDGTPVFIVGSNDTEPVENIMDTFAFWDGEMGTDNAGYGRKQVVHSDLMVTRVHQIRLHTQVLEYRNGNPCRRLMIDGLDGILITVTDLANWSREVLTVKDYGILPYSKGRWNVTSWLEPIETKWLK